MNRLPMRINVHIERSLTSLISKSYSCEQIVRLVRAKNREPPTGSRCCRLDEKPPVALFAAIFARCKGGRDLDNEAGAQMVSKVGLGEGRCFLLGNPKSIPSLPRS